MQNGLILQTENLNKDFNGLRALHGVSVGVHRNSIHGLIGPNGSGKTTFFNVVTGVLPSSAGRVIFEGKEITGVSATKACRLGIARTFQGGLLPPTMTCLENVMTGAYGNRSINIIDTFLRPPFTASKQEKKIGRQAAVQLELVGLAGYASRWTGDLVWVERQLLQIARALMAGPRLLLLDEPTAGMGPEESDLVKDLILKIRNSGITLIVVSHDVRLVAELSDNITVLNVGEVICDGPPAVVRQDACVMEAYLGIE